MPRYDNFWYSIFITYELLNQNMHAKEILHLWNMRHFILMFLSTVMLFLWKYIWKIENDFFSIVGSRCNFKENDSQWIITFYIANLAILIVIITYCLVICPIFLIGSNKLKSIILNLIAVYSNKKLFTQLLENTLM